jgi:dTDP-4-amino-4,6-dideoxygalactose transaminase
MRSSTRCLDERPTVAGFEASFASYSKAQHWAGVANGLDALRLGLIAARIEPGVEVVVRALTFAATFEALVQAGDSPMFVDLSKLDYTLDVEQVAGAIGPKTRLVLPVHLCGHAVRGYTARPATVESLALLRKLPLLEDWNEEHPRGASFYTEAPTAACAWLGQGPGSFPVADELPEEEFSLPLFPGLTQEHLDLVVAAIRDFLRRG